jgi:hypothetical protein
MDIDLNAFVFGFTNKEIKKLYLSFLYLIEDLKLNNKITEEEFLFLRKRVLDYGNNCSRNIEEQLNSFDFKLSKK